MDARCRGESRCNSGEYRDEDVQDFTPKCFVFHDFKFLELRNSTIIYCFCSPIVIHPTFCHSERSEESEKR